MPAQAGIHSAHGDDLRAVDPGVRRGDGWPCGTAMPSTQGIPAFAGMTEALPETQSAGRSFFVSSSLGNTFAPSM